MSEPNPDPNDMISTDTETPREQRATVPMPEGMRCSGWFVAVGVAGFLGALAVVAWEPLLALLIVHVLCVFPALIRVGLVAEAQQQAGRTLSLRMGLRVLLSPLELSFTLGTVAVSAGVVTCFAVVYAGNTLTALAGAGETGEHDSGSIFNPKGIPFLQNSIGAENHATLFDWLIAGSLAGLCVSIYVLVKFGRLLLVRKQDHETP